MEGFLLPHTFPISLTLRPLHGCSDRSNHVSQSHISPLPTAWYSGVGMHAPSQIHQLRSECCTTARGKWRDEKRERERERWREKEREKGAGMIRTEQEEFFIEPIERGDGLIEEEGGGGGRTHIVYRSAAVKKAPISSTAAEYHSREICIVLEGERLHVAPGDKQLQLAGGLKVGGGLRQLHRPPTDAMTRRPRPELRGGWRGSAIGQWCLSLWLNVYLSRK
ncbi:hypothetical protein PAMP_023637 [Pampus punctatissimus]